MDRPKDRVERMVYDALKDADIEFVGETDVSARGLDFYLPDFSLHIECKQFYTPRTDAQMQRVRNVIVIQGAHAAHAFGMMIARQQKEPNG
jgi:hypothetical protein